MEILLIFYELCHFGSNYGLGCNHIFILEDYYYFDISFNVIPLWKSVIFFWVFKKKLQKVEKMVVAEELSTVKIIFNH